VVRIRLGDGAGTGTGDPYTADLKMDGQDLGIRGKVKKNGPKRATEVPSCMVPETGRTKIHAGVIINCKAINMAGK